MKNYFYQILAFYVKSLIFKESMGFEYTALITVVTSELPDEKVECNR
jgi:hypothetical protein